MSGPNEYPSTGRSFPDDELISRLRGQDPVKKIIASKRLLKSNSDGFKNGKDLSLTTSVPPRAPTTARSIISEVKNGTVELSESSSSAAMKQSPTYSFEEPKQTVSQGSERAISALEAELNKTIAEACATSNKLENSKTECKNLRDQIVDLQKKLNDTEDFIFSLQRREQKITESEATAEFNSLCMMVEDWVQSKLGDAIEQKFAEKAALPNSMTRRLLSLIPQPGKDAFRYPDTDEYNVIAVIMRFLCIEIFDKDFYCQIDPGAVELLTSIERSMRNLEPRRDLITWRSWHSETFTAVTKRQEFVRQRQIHSEKLSIDLAAMLQVFLPRSDHQGFRLSVQSTIIEPALQLAHKMHLSVDQFKMQYTPYHRAKMEDRQPLPRESSPFECVMLSPPGKVLKFPVPKGILTYIFDLSPELVFRAVKTDSFGEPRVLKRARILVAVTKEEHGPYTGPAPLPREPPTFLGLLDETIHSKQTGYVKKSYIGVGFR